MKKTFVFVLAAFGVFLLAGCGEMFMNEMVACGEGAPVELKIKETAVAPNCNWADFEFSRAYAPALEACSNLVDGDGSREQLLGGEVKITSGDPFVYVCAGLDCDAQNRQATARIGADGVLAYEILYEAGISLSAGGEYYSRSVLVTENFGPGNSCPVYLELELKCEEP